MEPLLLPPRAIHRGVTLVELLVVLAIILILSSVLITSHATFNKTILLSNTAYDVALALRSAQTFGLGSRVKTGIADRNTGYGIHFTPGSSSFILFADANNPNDISGYNCHTYRDKDAPDAIPGNCMYDAGPEFTQTYQLGNGMKITKLFWYTSNGQSRFEDGNWLDVVFARPNTYAFIRSANNGYNENTSACIELTSPQTVAGGEYSIYVRPTGEIHVTTRPCTPTL